MNFKSIKSKKWFKVTVAIILISAVSYGFYYYKFRTTAVNATYAVVSKVTTGTVSSGISASGAIVAAHKLDLNVYKQAQRIESVNIQNGGHVDANQVILSFDKSSAYVSVETSKVALSESKLALQNQKSNITDPNTTLNSLANDISSLQSSIVQAGKDKDTTYRNYLNANIKADSGNKQTENKTRPTVSGLYFGTAEGKYQISIYGSSAVSGYSYNVSGLEMGTQSVSANLASKVGTKGLEIKFPNDVSSGDVWIINLPNTGTPEYVQNKETYNKTITKLNQDIAGYKVDIANKQLQIKNLGQTDNSSSRNLDVAKAQADLSKASVQLTQNYNAMKEQDIVAPFSGTLEGAENVVVGATPTRDNSDTTNLGTLISDDFLVKFDLGAVDINKVTIGQKVLVSITSYPNSQPLEASITSISSLPNSTGVAQYSVEALISNVSTSTIKNPLREGLVADVEIVQKEKVDVLRVPLSAITYTNQKPTVQVLSDLSADEQSQIDKMGVLKSLTGTFPSYPKEITLGIVGAFYAEVTSGLDANQLIIVSQTVKAESTVVTQRNFSPGGGGADRSAGGNTGGARTTTGTNTAAPAPAQSKTTAQ